jgi:heat shock protein HtpX
MFAGSPTAAASPLAPLAALLAPFGAMIIQFAISRSREYKADAHRRGNQWQPLALASALGKLESAAKQIPMGVSPAMAPLAMVNPLSAFRGGLAAMFSTHPPIEERIARLEAIARGENLADAQLAVGWRAGRAPRETGSCRAGQAALTAQRRRRTSVRYHD